MKHCPICDAKYDDEKIHFCTKDGSPLIDDEQPNFLELPSESLDEPEDDPGEVTVIRHKPTPQAAIGDDSKSSGERIVIPTSSEPPAQQVRPRSISAYYAPPPQSNTVKTVVLTIIGTMAVLGFGAGGFWFLQKETPANKNVNTNANLLNQNTNLNTNMAFDSNFNFNSNGNYSINSNFGPTNLKTPTPTPKTTPSATPTPLATPSPSPTPRPTPRTSPSVRPTPSGTPRIGPRPPTPNANH